MSTEKILELESLVNAATSKMQKITSKKIFGCHAVWVNENVFALVWKHGRIGVKLPVEKSFDLLMSAKGAEPWKAGPMKMAHWVLVPEKFHSDKTELKKWVKKAYDECSELKKQSKGLKKAKAKPKSVNKVVKKSKKNV